MQVISSEDSDFDAVSQSLIVKQNEDLWRTAKPLTHQCILVDQTLDSKGNSSKRRKRVKSHSHSNLNIILLYNILLEFLNMT